jgi:ankyrin repeat protein
MLVASRIAVVACALAFPLITGAPVWAGPLHDAARAGDGATVAQLLRDGADIDERDETGETALFAAASAGLPKIIDQLMIAGADAAIRDDRGMTAVHAAAANVNAEAISVLVGDAKLTARIDLNDHANELGVTPLIVAAEKGHGNIVAHLVGLGADLEIVGRDGYTALTRAGHQGHDQIVTILLRSGAKCQEIDPAWRAECSARRAALGLK